MWKDKIHFKINAHECRLVRKRNEKKEKDLNRLPDEEKHLRSEQKE